MKTKKILIVITKSGWGGAQKYVYDLVTNLPQDQFEVTVALGGNGLLAERLREKNIRVLNIPAFQRDINFFKEISAFFQLLKIFRQERPDIIHLNSSKAGVLGSLAAFLYKLVTPVLETFGFSTGQAFNFKLLTVYTVHGWAFKEDRNFLSIFYLWLVSWFSSLFQSKIIVINKADLASAKKFIPSGKLSLIYNGIDIINFIPREKARAFLTEKTGAKISKDTLLVGVIAELNKNKGLAYLIDAFQYLNLKLIIIGEGEDLNKLQDQIKNLGLQKDVFLTGFMRDANQYLKAFDIFALPSLKEGLPYTIIDAMAAELPVVASRVGGIPDLITHNENGLLVSTKNSRELAKSIDELAASPILRKELGSKAKLKIERGFNLRNMLTATISLYKNV
ncbi:MAG: glycosyltransferase family 4 protein [bacterium]|nr:glycosyltransferase family 4 protein [bacterium]